MQAATVMIQSALPSIDTQLEERLRRASQTGRIRFSEFFKDFDPLKSGVITSRLPASSDPLHGTIIYLSYSEMQFCRCLDQHLSVRLSEADYDFLVAKYGNAARGTVNYRAFCNAMEKGVCM